MAELAEADRAAAAVLAGSPAPAPNPTPGLLQRKCAACEAEEEETVRRAAGNGTWRFDVDGTWLAQDPASPHPREGRVLSAAVPLDANHNPLDAELNEKRLFVNTGYSKNTTFGSWNTTIAFTHSSQDALRGFLADVGNSAPNANGFDATIDQTDLYLDTHVRFTHSSRVQGVFGFDHLHGKADAEGDLFSYFIPLSGSNPPGDDEFTPLGDARIANKREFSGLYGFVEWNPTAKLAFEAGAMAPETSMSANRSDMRKDLDAAIGALPERYRAVVMLYYLEDVSYPEIAEILELPLGTVKTHLHRAKRMLREHLDGWGSGEVEAEDA